MKDFFTFPLTELLAPRMYECNCGQMHSAQLSYIAIGSGAIASFPEALRAAYFTYPFIICDTNTKAAAWAPVKAVLDQHGIPYLLHTFDREHLEPDEYAIGNLAMAFDRNCDVVVALGSGVLNDCAKVLAHITGLKSMVIATAPSMDGYASNSSSMIVDGVKSTLYNECPCAIIADTDIIRKAPDRMLWAGFGDMVAKYIAICEWRIAHLVTGEYYCENIAKMMRRSVQKIVDSADKLMQREPEAIEAVMEGLILSGIAMAYAENSRPASGLEHYFSHVWEMMALERGQLADLHGIQVGVGTVLALQVLDQVKGISPTREKAEAAMRAFDPAAWEANVRRVFGKTAGRVLDIEAKSGKNTPERQSKHMDAILANWDVIVQIMQEELPETDKLVATMKSLGMPITPGDLGISQQDVLDAYFCSRDIRDKYLTSSMLWDLGLLKEILP